MEKNKKNTNWKHYIGMTLVGICPVVSFIYNYFNPKLTQMQVLFDVGPYLILELVIGAILILSEMKKEEKRKNEELFRVSR
jgi:hypothetical protein